MIDRNDSCWCGSGAKWKRCHWPAEGIASFETLKGEYFKKHKIHIKSEAEIAAIREAGHLAAKILDLVAKEAKAGVTTKELDRLAAKLTAEHGAKPASLGYSSPPYPAVLCTSLNEVICHGIPDDRELREGDIVNIDFACILRGYYGDCSKMVAIGEVSEEKQRVMETCLEALLAAVAIVEPGVPLSLIGEVISEIAEKKRLSVVRDYVGHGVGIGYHENPQVPHCRNSQSLLLVPGMIFTIEPMLNVGVIDGVVDPRDRWTVRTKDLKPSAQWEHQILVTERGHEVLTPWSLP